MDEIDQLLGKYGAPAPKPKGDDVDGILSKYAAPSGYHGQYRMVGQDKPADVPRLPPVADINRPAPAGPSQLESGVRGFVQGASANLADEGAGVVRQLPYSQDIGSLNEGAPMFGDAAAAAGQKAIDASKDGAKAYVQGRDEYRAADKAAQEANPLTFGAAELGGTVASSFVPLGATVKGASTASKVIRAAGRGAAAAGVQAAGASDADLTKGEGARFVKDVGKGAATGALVAGAGEGAAALLNKAGAAVKGGLKKRILNEVAEGDGVVKTTPTGRQQIERAGNNVFKEVVHNDDADAVRKAYLSSPRKGQELLAPIVDKVGASNRAAYDAIEASGRDVVDMAAYQAHLDKIRESAVKSGQSLVANSLAAFQKHILDQEAAAGGKMTIRQLRGLTTEAGAIAASAVGGFNGHLPAEVKGLVSRTAVGAMDASLTRATQGDAALEKAAATIRENNQRMNALLTIRESLERRSAKAETGRSALVRAAEKLSNPAAIAGGGAALYGIGSGGDIEDKAKRAALGLAVIGGARALPAAARGVDRLITSGGIAAARSGTPVMGNTAERLARALGRTGAGMFATHKATEQEEQSK